jgi:hypothetical protein
VLTGAFPLSLALRASGGESGGHQHGPT